MDSLFTVKPDEHQTFDDYLEKCTDHRTIINEAVKQPENTDTILNSIERLTPKMRTVFIKYYPNPLNASLLNFLDAFILGKNELSTFDGILLDYPESSPRFATLVGNRTQLDDTTLFSTQIMSERPNIT
ncbi:unnamed protein product [Strongylus vulgaris]|uniref:Uncharacterized protein n=1 Tax=Strongylus vulgaris TaxID=40348 RepID=A0A3P7IS95_STRVU|nr:unnamed protein product [Strongylus vulgaris]